MNSLDHQDNEFLQCRLCGAVYGYREDECEALREAVNIWGCMPYRKCWIVVKEHEHFRVVCEATAHRVGMLQRQGWTVFALVKS